MGTALTFLTGTPYLRRAVSWPIPQQTTRKELTLLLQLNPMLGTAPNISLETSMIIKLLLKSYGSQAAQDGLLGSGTHLKPTTSSSPTEIPSSNTAPAVALIWVLGH